MFRINYLKLILSITFILIQHANIAEASEKFYSDRERGWYFYEQNEQGDTNKQPHHGTKSVKEMNPDEVLAMLDTVQKEMRVRNARLSLEPTVENARSFMEYQSKMFAHASKTSDAMQTALLKFPHLDTRIENPISEQAIQIKHQEDNVKNNKKITEFSNHFSLIYFYKTGCGYCERFRPVLERFTAEYKFKIVAISNDGSKLDNIPTVRDMQLAEKLNVKEYPTLIAFNSKNKIYVPISRGYMPEDDLKRNVLHVYDHLTKLTMEVK